VCLFFIPYIHATIDVPISKYEVNLDGIVDFSEWSDAYQIQLDSFDGGYFDFYIKYDLDYEELQIGFIADDSDARAVYIKD
jgi:hypothetical protein